MDKPFRQSLPGASAYYTPKHRVFQRYRLIIYIILFSAALAVGMFIDLPYLFVGAAIAVKGVDLFIYRFLRGWHWRLTDKYLIAAGLAQMRIAFLDIHIKDLGWIDEITIQLFLLTLGIIYPLLTTLELALMKLRLGKEREAEAADVILSGDIDSYGPAGNLTCPVFLIRDDAGREQYVCDEWFSRAGYLTGEKTAIRVRPEHSTEIWDRKRVRDCLMRSWRFWLIYEAVIAALFLAMSRT